MLYNVVLLSVVQQSESTTHIHISSPSQRGKGEVGLWKSADTLSHFWVHLHSLLKVELWAPKGLSEVLNPRISECDCLWK